jgi:hypothetical protein
MSIIKEPDAVLHSYPRTTARPELSWRLSRISRFPTSSQCEAQPATAAIGRRHFLVVPFLDIRHACSIIYS